MPGSRPADPLWYKDAVLYEVHVRAFADGNGDGIGDFIGLTQKLDYIADLGVTAVWVLPFYPSPLRDDGYDIADYTTVHPSYGTLDDFRTFLDEAHKRNLKVITELVINHTSDQHPWFQRARRSPHGTPERDFYVWSDAPEKYKGVRIIFQDFEPSNWSWDPIAKSYYWHRFYGHQPDLNYDNPAVHDAILPLVDYWMDLGVDGMRLDAVPYLYEREGTSCENLPETHAFLKKLRAHTQARFPDRMLLAEANQWPEDAIAYFGDGDECHMAFHFPVMPRMFMAVRMEDRYPIIDIMQQTPPIPDTCQWAMFLRNHDELTLEMVTDEERDYMYRAYATDPQARINLGIRRRLAPLLGNDRRKIELMLVLLFSLPGTPVLYYGDEIGMGDNFYLGDRNGVRTPMQWSADRNAGFSKANPQKLYLPVIIDPEYHYESLNVEGQQNNPNSLLWFHKRLLAGRKRYQAFGRGDLTFLHPENYKVLAFVRRYKDEQILVIANLSRFAQHVELNLRDYQGLVPVEMSGQVEFPPAGDGPYSLSLGPYGYYVFSLTMPRPIELPRSGAGERGVPALKVINRWDDLVRGPQKSQLEALLPGHLLGRGWYRGGGRTLRTVDLLESVELPNTPAPTVLTGARIDYGEGDPDVYALPLAFAEGPAADEVMQRQPFSAVARVLGGQEGLIYDAMYDPGFNTALLGLFAGGRRLTGVRGSIIATLVHDHAAVDMDTVGPANPRRADQNRAETTFGDKLVLTLYRQLEFGPHADWEIGRHLAAVRFPYTRPIRGLLEYRQHYGEHLTLGTLQENVPTQSDAWQYTLHALGRYCERALSAAGPAPDVPLTVAAIFDAADDSAVDGIRPAPGVTEPAAHVPTFPEMMTDPAALRPGSGSTSALDAHPNLAADMIEPYLEWARLVGRRTAELHAALANPADDPAFLPEPATPLYLRSVYQSLRNQAGRVLRRLARRLRLLSPEVQADAKAVLDREAELHHRFRAIMSRRWGGLRSRVHGDLHLGQILVTGSDVLFVHFGGDVAASPSERRQKRTALVDVAGLLRSFQRAADTALNGTEVGTSIVRPEDRATLEPWGRFWVAQVGGAFLRSYFSSPEIGGLIPSTREERQALCEVFLLGQVVTELGVALSYRPEVLHAHLRGLFALLGGTPRREPTAVS
ncbi:MAG TPA: maltose alpha-D-glucosyltransferase [Gemmataceae bacterium]|nr:maltose alpha-D-glucosyltransferase [Gemmataceae bacterium]